ncbi:MAG: hypothetical protein FJW39_08575 [Acidobacteria bacterium]|nr:hypothetical protein [Acidobacteriota bacterium]
MARLISGVWAFFWTWFGMASGIAEGAGIPGTLVHMAPGLLFTALVWTAWRHETAGGLALLMASFLVFVYYPFLAGPHLATHVAVASVLLLGLPPLIAGMMFVMYHGKR